MRLSFLSRRTRLRERQRIAFAAERRRRSGIFNAAADAAADACAVAVDDASRDISPQA